MDVANPEHAAVNRLSQIEFVLDMLNSKALETIGHYFALAPTLFDLLGLSLSMLP